MVTAGITKLTPVQEQCLPHLLSGSDCLAKAKTGTGKTVAFLLPTMHRLLAGAQRIPNASLPGGVDPIRAIVLSSARELATQIVTQAEALGQFAPELNIVSILGGYSINPQRQILDPNCGLSR